MFALCINMSRFHDFSLYKRTDELLCPAEKNLSAHFHSTENIQLVYKKALTEVDSGVSYSDVTAKMDAVFRIAISTEDLPGVDQMNNSVLESLASDYRRASENQKRFAERVFTNSNVPSRILPRASYSSNNGDSEDDVDGTVGRKDKNIELLRR
ncbi:unnamed protein product [Ectocarpus sp. 12 AP-2014]